MEESLSAFFRKKTLHCCTIFFGGIESVIYHFQRAERVLCSNESLILTINIFLQTHLKSQKSNSFCFQNEIALWKFWSKI